jgi:hypothetical protein
LTCGHSAGMLSAIRSCNFETLGNDPWSWRLVYLSSESASLHLRVRSCLASRSRQRDSSVEPVRISDGLDLQRRVRSIVAEGRFHVNVPTAGTEEHIPNDLLTERKEYMLFLELTRNWRLVLMGRVLQAWLNLFSSRTDLLPGFKLKLLTWSFGSFRNQIHWFSVRGMDVHRGTMWTREFARTDPVR